MTIHDPPLTHVSVGSVMHVGVLTTDPRTSLQVVARLMTDTHVHAIAVADPDSPGRPLGFVSVRDVASAAADCSDLSAGEAAGTAVVTVANDDSVVEAAQLMVEHSVDHLLVIDAVTGHPSGILSGADIAAAYASAA